MPDTPEKAESKAVAPEKPAPVSSPGRSQSQERPDVVAFKNVTKSFKEGGSARVAIQDINFVV